MTDRVWPKRTYAKTTHVLSLLSYALAGIAAGVPDAAGNPGGVPDYQEIPVCTDPARQINPRISGNFIVWQDSRDPSDYPSAYGSVWGYALSTGTEFPIASTGDFDGLPDIDGNLVVWYRNWTMIMGYDLATGTEFVVADARNEQQRPSISGQTVVWQDRRNGNWDIYGKDLATGMEFPVHVGPGDQLYPRISGQNVVWEDRRNGNWDIYGRDLATGTVFPISTLPNEQMRPNISGRWVVWMDSDGTNLYDTSVDQDVYAYDLTTGLDTPIAVDPDVKERWPDVDDRFNAVVWRDDRYSNSDIFAYRIDTGVEYEVSTDPRWQTLPAIEGNLVAWRDMNLYDDEHQDYDIIAAYVPVPEPATLGLLVLGSGLAVVHWQRRGRRS